MNITTWIVFYTGMAASVLVITAFIVSLIPGMPEALRDGVASTWGDVRSWWHQNGRHVLTGAPVHDPIECACEVSANDAPVLSSPGATEDWSPAAEVAAVERDAIAAGELEPEPAAFIAHAKADPEELAILADLDAWVESHLVVPDWLLDWAVRTDEALRAAGCNAEAHQRWRQGVLDVPTGEYPQLVALPA